MNSGSHKNYWFIDLKRSLFLRRKHILEFFLPLDFTILFFSYCNKMNFPTFWRIAERLLMKIY